MAILPNIDRYTQTNLDLSSFLVMIGMYEWCRIDPIYMILQKIRIELLKKKKASNKFIPSPISNCMICVFWCMHLCIYVLLYLLSRWNICIRLRSLLSSIHLQTLLISHVVHTRAYDKIDVYRVLSLGIQKFSNWMLFNSINRYFECIYFIPAYNLLCIILIFFYF